MRKLFSILAFVALYVGVTLGQAALDIPITMSDNAGGSKAMNFGLDPTATDGIDPALGESDLPPFPPAGAFEARFWLPPFTAGALTTYKDYRNAPAFPYTGAKEHRVKWQYTDLATALTFTYDLPLGVQITITSNNTTPVWTSGPRTGSGSYTLDDVDNSYVAGRIYVVYTAVIIPVELVSFNASVIGSSVKLDWATATETNNSGFEVQRKSENSAWEKIGFVEGAGTTTERKQYTYTDKLSASSGKYFYRLRQIDFDGTSNFSAVVSADISAPVEFKLNQNYPNPFNPSTTVSFTIPKASNVKLSIYNQIGQQVGELVNRNLEAGSYNYTWNAGNQSSGIYFYELQANEFKSVRKMTLIK
jgi:hypothetical protein